MRDKRLEELINKKNELEEALKKINLELKSLTKEKINYEKSLKIENKNELENYNKIIVDLNKKIEENEKQKSELEKSKKGVATLVKTIKCSNTKIKNKRNAIEDLNKKIESINSEINDLENEKRKQLLKIGKSNNGKRNELIAKVKKLEVMQEEFEGNESTEGENKSNEIENQLKDTKNNLYKLEEEIAKLYTKICKNYDSEKAKKREELLEKVKELIYADKMIKASEKARTNSLAKYSKSKDESKTNNKINSTLKSKDESKTNNKINSTLKSKDESKTNNKINSTLKSKDESKTNNEINSTSKSKDESKTNNEINSSLNIKNKEKVIDKINIKLSAKSIIKQNKIEKIIGGEDELKNEIDEYIKDLENKKTKQDKKKINLNDILKIIEDKELIRKEKWSYETVDGTLEQYGSLYARAYKNMLRKNGPFIKKFDYNNETKNKLKNNENINQSYSGINLQEIDNMQENIENTLVYRGIDEKTIKKIIVREANNKNENDKYIEIDGKKYSINRNLDKITNYEVEQICKKYLGINDVSSFRNRFAMQNLKNKIDPAIVNAIKERFFPELIKGKENKFYSEADKMPVFFCSQEDEEKNEKQKQKNRREYKKLLKEYIKAIEEKCNGILSFYIIYDCSGNMSISEYNNVNPYISAAEKAGAHVIGKRKFFGLFKEKENLNNVIQDASKTRYVEGDKSFVQKVETSKQPFNSNITENVKRTKVRTNEYIH